MTNPFREIGSVDKGKERNSGQGMGRTELLARSGTRTTTTLKSLNTLFENFVFRYSLGRYMIFGMGEICLILPFGLRLVLIIN